MTEATDNEDDGSKTTNARRSRAERAKSELERRRRSSSTNRGSNGKSSDVNTNSTSKSKSGNTAHSSTATRDRISSYSNGGNGSSSNSNSNSSSSHYHRSERSSEKSSTKSASSRLNDGTSGKYERPYIIGGSSSNTGSGSRRPSSANSSSTAYTKTSTSNSTSTTATATTTTRIRSPIRERMEELRSSRLGMSSNSNNNSNSASKSRTDMSPTGRMRLEQQTSQQTQQSQPSQSQQSQQQKRQRRGQQMQHAKQSQRKKHPTQELNSNQGSQQPVTTKNVPITNARQKNLVQNKSFSQQQQQQQQQQQSNHQMQQMKKQMQHQQQQQPQQQQMQHLQQQSSTKKSSQSSSSKKQPSSQQQKPTISTTNNNTIQSPQHAQTPQQYQQIQQQQQQQQQQPTLISISPTSATNTPLHENNIVPPTSPASTKELSIESPLPPLVHRALGDRSYEKRKNAALEVEALVKHLADPSIPHNNNNNNSPDQMIYALIQILSKEFCLSMNSNFRKGGLIGLAATGIGLMSQNLLTQSYLESLIRPVLQCFDDPEPRVRYYACESLYNIVKVARGSILSYFNLIFDGLTKLFADVEDEVKNGANLLDRLVKDIVTESDDFSVNEFLPLLQKYMRRTNPYIRQLLVGWITVLDGIPDVSMLDYLPDFLDGLFNMLADSNREIRQAADSALCEFLKEIQSSSVVEFGPLISILVFQCHSKDRLNRLTALTWLNEFIHHPHSGGDALLSFHAAILGAVLSCISDSEVEIRKVSDRTNGDLLTLVKDTEKSFELAILLDTLTKELSGKDDVPTKMAALKWINMLLEKRRRDLNVYTDSLLPFLLQSLSDSSDSVVLLTVQVISRITLSEVNLQSLSEDGAETKSNGNSMKLDDTQFMLVIKAILSLFASDRRLLETRGSLIVRRLCVLLNAKSVYTIMAEILSSYDITSTNGDSFTLEFVATMIQTLNLILLTASELHHLRKLLESSFAKESAMDSAMVQSTTNNVSKVALNYGRPTSAGNKMEARNEGAQVFASLFHCWCNNPVSTFSLCLLARAYDLAFALVKKFSEFELTVGFLMQIDKLAHLLESPVFVHIRLQLLDVETPYHTYLLKSCYGLLMILPQSDAFQSLNDRLTAVCNLRDNLGVRPSLKVSPEGIVTTESSSIYQAGLDAVLLLRRFDYVMEMHRSAREAIQRKEMQKDKDYADEASKRLMKNSNKQQQQQQQQVGGVSSSAGNQPSNGMTNIQKAGIGAVIASGIQ